MARASETHEYTLRVRNLTGALLRGRFNQSGHDVLCDTATGPVYAHPGDLILLLPNGRSIVLRKDDYKYLVNVLPTQEGHLARLVNDAAIATEIFSDDELEAHADAILRAHAEAIVRAHADAIARTDANEGH